MTREQFEQMVATAKTARISDKIESLYDDKLYQEASINLAVESTVVDTLLAVEDKCAAIVAAMPLYNAKTRENRKWSPTQAYSYPQAIAAIIRIASGITYSAQEHRVQMLATTGLSSVLLQKVLDSMPVEAYYNKNYAVIIDGRDGNIAEFAQAVQQVATALGTVVDISSLTPEFVRAKAELAQIRAEKAQAEAEKATLLNEGRIVVE